MVPTSLLLDDSPVPLTTDSFSFLPLRTHWYIIGGLTDISSQFNMIEAKSISLYGLYMSLDKARFHNYLLKKQNGASGDCSHD